MAPDKFESHVPEILVAAWADLHINACFAPPGAFGFTITGRPSTDEILNDPSAEDMVL